MTAGDLLIETIVNGPFMENTYILRREGRLDCVVVDPGLEPQMILDALADLRLEPALFLITHGHGDHIGGNRALKQKWPAVPLVIGAGDAVMLIDPIKNLSGLLGMPVTSPPADRTVVEGEHVEAAGMKFEVLEIPGHSLGHVVYLMRDEKPHVVLGGDVLFEGSIGRTDFPGGNLSQLVSGIRTKLFTLPDDTVVFPGHGAATTTGEERRTNPFCGEEG